MRYRYVFLSCFGNTLEWFDYGLFIYFAPIIGAQFFHLADPTHCEMAAFAVFAAGFICRPLGGLFFGFQGDKIGRAFSLRWSIICVSASTLLIGILPGFKQWGIFSSLGFILLRLLQGFAIGGEYGGAMVYLAENAPLNRRALYMGFIASSSNLGFVLAIITMLALTQFFSSENIVAKAWRIPFILAGCAGTAISYYRLRFMETPLFIKWHKEHHERQQPLNITLKKHFKTIIYIVLFTCVGAPAYYVFFGFMPNYLVGHLKLNPHFTDFVEIFSLILFALLIPFFGLLSDRCDRRKIVYVTVINMLISYLPIFYLFNHSSWTYVILGFLLITLLFAYQEGATFPIMVECTPLNVRYTLVAFAYNLGNGLFGGTTPLVVSWIVQNFGHYAIACYLMMMTIIALWAFYHLDTTIMAKEAGSAL